MLWSWMMLNDVLWPKLSCFGCIPWCSVNSSCWGHVTLVISTIRFCGHQATKHKRCSSQICAIWAGQSWQLFFHCCFASADFLQAALTLPSGHKSGLGSPGRFEVAEFLMEMSRKEPKEPSEPLRSLSFPIGNPYSFLPVAVQSSADTLERDWDTEARWNFAELLECY